MSQKHLSDIVNKIQLGKKIPPKIVDQEPIKTPEIEARKPTQPIDNEVSKHWKFTLIPKSLKAIHINEALKYFIINDKDVANIVDMAWGTWNINKPEQILFPMPDHIQAKTGIKSFYIWEMDNGIYFLI